MDPSGLMFSIYKQTNPLGRDRTHYCFCAHENNVLLGRNTPCSLYFCLFTRRYNFAPRSLVTNGGGWLYGWTWLGYCNARVPNIHAGPRWMSLLAQDRIVRERYAVFAGMVGTCYEIYVNHEKKNQRLLIFVSLQERLVNHRWGGGEANSRQRLEDRG